MSDIEIEIQVETPTRRIEAAILQAEHKLRLAAHQVEHHIPGRREMASCTSFCSVRGAHSLLSLLLYLQPAKLEGCPLVVNLPYDWGCCSMTQEDVIRLLLQVQGAYHTGREGTQGTVLLETWHSENCSSPADSRPGQLGRQLL